MIGEIQIPTVCTRHIYNRQCCCPKCALKDLVWSPGPDPISLATPRIRSWRFQLAFAVLEGLPVERLLEELIELIVSPRPDYVRGAIKRVYQRIVLWTPGDFK